MIRRSLITSNRSRFDKPWEIVSERQSRYTKLARFKKREEAHILNHLGAIHSDLGEKREAIDHYQQALQASRAAKAKDEEAISLKRLGELSSETGEKQKRN